MNIDKERELFKEEVSELDSFDLNDFTLNPFDWDEENQKFYFNPTQLMWEVWQAAKAQAVPEGFVLVKNVHPDAIVHNQGLGLFKECQIIYGWDGKSKDFKDALNKGFYHWVKLGAKAVLETTMIEAQEQSHD